MNNILSFFDEDEPDFCDYYSNPLREFDLQKLLSLERDSLGIYLSGNPLKPYMGLYKDGKYDTVSSFEEISDEKKVKIFGIIDSVKLATTRQLRDMAYLTIEDITGVVDVIFFPKQFMEYKTFMNVGSIVEISGTVSKKEDEVVQIICNRAVFPSEDLMRQKSIKLYVKFSSETDFEYKYVLHILKQSPGESSCVFHFSKSGKTFATNDRLKVKITDRLIDELAAIVGQENIVIK